MAGLSPDADIMMRFNHALPKILRWQFDYGPHRKRSFATDV